MQKLGKSSINITRRRFLHGSAAAGAGLLAGSMLSTSALAQAKPDKLVVAALMIKWRRTLEEEVGPAFEKETGIKVEFEFLPYDALATRIKTQLDARDGSLDVAQFDTVMVNWAAPQLADFNQLIKEYGAEGYNWDDFLPAAKDAFTVDGKVVAAPYRFLSTILHYRPDLLEAAGITAAPRTFEEFQNAATAVTEKFGGEKFGVGIYGRESEAMVRGWNPFQLSSGGRDYNLATKEILINKPESVNSLQFYADLVNKHKVTPPEASTWEYDGLVAGGQADRFAMMVALAPNGTLLDDPGVSKTAGKWAWSTVPGATDPSQSMGWSGGWGIGVAEASANKRWAFEFVKMATNTINLKKSAFDGNSPPRKSNLADAQIVSKLKWSKAFAEQNAVPIPMPNDPVFAICDQQIRPHISRALLGQATAQEALDAAAKEWHRTFQRAGLL
ncbi:MULTISPECIES: sugar ABC transporter substrate-binding protein [unclassified Mesorhizobium]|uniref:ABC transporter substrate-binding protein n=1 Tax=unclassified Mesorhizobium TaxID=325217 RepID=UPI000FDC0F2D|nr:MULTISPECIES: sugar ABC transporter substrate-binding protein [unclassified Mesorhizobium]TGT71938.1 sugar ABC transporter substrate-binding protein [Mesorhizobium sp. M2E.F.Ca.ET.166.01.1.1]TGV99347.1 sugar ABC transporter substrate-binding protein [Mesorhizobium sp. M2E.F.Ca.ET.154.01.1.1]